MAAKDLPPELKAEMWAGWTHDAMSVFPSPDELGDQDDIEELVADMADLSCAYADEMLEEFEKRFGKGGGGRRKKRKSKTKDDDDEPESER